jgi:hypothetical protein
MRLRSLAFEEVKFKKMPTGDREPIAMTEVERAKRLNAVLSLKRLCDQHSAGEISGAQFSDVLQGYARTEFGTAPDALQKYIRAHHAELSQKLAHDYSAMQQAHDGQQRTGVRSGIGITGQENGVMSDGINSPNAVGQQPPAAGNYTKFAHPRDVAVTVENVKELAKSHFGGDIVRAATELRRAGEEEFGSGA